MVSLFEDGKWLIPDQRRLTCRKTLSLSSGAVPVLDTDPATAPAISCRHTNPDCFSFSENSSGTVKCSPMSNIYTNKYTTVELQKERSYSIYSHENLSVSVLLRTTECFQYWAISSMLCRGLNRKWSRHSNQSMVREWSLSILYQHISQVLHVRKSHLKSTLHACEVQKHTFAGFWRPAPAWRPRRDCVTTAGSPRRPVHLQNTQCVTVLKYEIIDLKTELMELMLMLIWGIDANSDVKALTAIS